MVGQRLRPEGVDLEVRRLDRARGCGLPLLRGLLRQKQLVTPFRKSVVSSRGYYLLRSRRATGKAEVAEFESWLLGEAKKDRAKDAPALNP